MARRALYWCRPLPNGGLQLIELDTKPPPREPRGPAIHLDSMPPLEHMMDGRIYDSKSEFRKTTKRLGGIEVGNEKVPRVPNYANSKDFEKDFEKDFDKARQEAANLTVSEREKLKTIWKKATNDPEFRDIPIRDYTAD